MKKHRYTTAYQDESRFFFSALALLAIVFIAYIYFVSSSVAHVVMRQEVDATITNLSTEISQLEAHYIEMQHRVSTEVATERGFVFADSKIFIDTSGDTLVLSQN